MSDDIKDPNFTDKWEKKSYNHDHPDGTRTEVHYWENFKTKERTGFKIKDDSNAKSRFNKGK